MARSRRLKDVRLIAERLTARYHDYAHNNRKDPYRELVFILCSTMTQQDVHERVYTHFIRRFPTLEKVAKTSPRSLVTALREGGLASRKAMQLKAIAKQVRRETGRYDLNALAGLEDDILDECLRRLPGVGPKVARCVMMYSYARHVFPVDTHCWRTAQRLGWLGRRHATMTAKGVDTLQEHIPPTLRFSLHVNLVSLGRDVCKAGRPLCERCVLADICPSSTAKSKDLRKSRKPMSESKLDYDSKNRKSILALAKRLEGKTLGELIPSVRDRANYGHKGEFGNLVERLIFGINPNPYDRPDLEEAGVEIKTAPLRDRPKAGRVPKERLVLGKIDYSAIITEKFDKSKFWSKNACLLILFYLWEKGLDPYQYEFLKSILHEFEDEDLRIIRKDWERIRQKVLDGLAHEISEGDTLYLGACTKGADSTERVSQPRSKTLAKPRAFSLKTSYIRVLLEKTAGLVPLKVPKVTDIEKFVLDELARYSGWGEKKMINQLCAGKGAAAKNRYRMMINRMLDLPSDAKIEQFEKADVQVKTIRIQKSGKIKESMSFRNIDFFELLKNSDWDESELYHDVSRRFLFCIFREDLGGKGYGFDTAFFWNMPVRDLDEVHRVWAETRKRARAKRYGQLPRSTESNVAHVRTKGRNNKDLTKTPNNGLITKRCFWLNRTYVTCQLTAHLRMIQKPKS